MGVTGDYAKLAKLRESLAKVSAAGLTTEMADVLGAASMKLVDDEFRAQRDPYGKSWEPLSRKYRRPRGARARAKILRDTRAMAASVNYSVQGRGLRLNIPKVYAPVHQYGATIAARSNVRGQKLRGRYTKNGQFRFVKKGQAGILLNAKRATFGEVKIPQRQMLPMASTGGLGPFWLAKYNTEARALLKRRLQVAA